MGRHLLLRSLTLSALLALFACDPVSLGGDGGASAGGATGEQRRDDQHHQHQRYHQQHRQQYQQQQYQRQRRYHQHQQHQHQHQHQYQQHQQQRRHLRCGWEPRATTTTPALQGDIACMAGVCVGTPVAGCSLYYSEGFENCSDGWTFGGDWQCGAPTGMSPVTPHTGKNVVATQLDGLYHPNQTFCRLHRRLADHRPDRRDQPGALLLGVGLDRGRHLRRLEPQDQHQRRDDLPGGHDGGPRLHADHREPGGVGRRLLRPGLAELRGGSQRLQGADGQPAVRLPQRPCDRVPGGLHRQRRRRRAGPDPALHHHVVARGTHTKGRPTRHSSPAPAATSTGGGASIPAA